MWVLVLKIDSFAQGRGGNGVRATDSIAAQRRPGKHKTLWREQWKIANCIDPNPALPGCWTPTWWEPSPIFPIYARNSYQNLPQGQFLGQMPSAADGNMVKTPVANELCWLRHCHRCPWRAPTTLAGSVGIFCARLLDPGRFLVRRELLRP